MSVDDEELRCKRCGKLCGKASSLRRHGYYCRSRPVGRPTSRKRCCEACTRAKIRCDTILPACSSCTSRGIPCNYDDNARQNLARRSKAIGGGKEAAQDGAIANDIIFDELSEPMSWDSGTSPDDSLDLSFLNMPLAQSLDLLPSLDAMSSGVDSIPSMFDGGFNAPLNPSAFLQWKNPKVLYQKVAPNPQAQMALMMMKGVIESYPHMMLRKETFPPFISSRSHGFDSEDVPETLKDCMGLAQMFATRTPESSNLIWRTMRMEQEKMLAQHESYSNHELQAAVQAVLIYIMMRLQDQKGEYEEVEIPLLHTLKMTSKALAARICEVESRGDYGMDEQHWQDWLFKESRRRCLTLARLMNMAFSIDRALEPDCFVGFDATPLPAKKVLWEAQNEQQWRNEYDECRRSPEHYRLTHKGEIVGIQQTAYGLQSRNVAFQEWYAGQDSGSGILVYLASQVMA